MLRAGVRPGCLGVVAAEAALAHPCLPRQCRKREIVGQMRLDPGMKHAEFVLDRLQRQCRAELRLPARPF